MASNKTNFSIVEAAIKEYHEHGVNNAVRCDQCQSLIKIKKLESNSLMLSCDCEKFNGPLRGL
jgi:hypothetical protein